MQKSNRLYTLLIVILISTAIAACGRRRVEPTPTPEPVTLRYMTLGESPAEQALIEHFEERNPAVEIDIISYSALPASVLLSSDAPPDLMAMTPGWFLDSAVETGELTDLSDLWEQTGLSQSYPAGVRALSEFEGKQYFLPTGMSWNAVYYNKALFDEFGFEPPTTWDELITIADVLTASDITPFAMPGDDLWMMSLWFSYLNFRLNGPEIHQQLLQGDIRFTDAEILDVFALWGWMFEQGYFSAGAASIDNMKAHMSVIRGDNGEVVRDKTAMLLTGPGFINELPAKFKEELDFFPFPVIDQSVPHGEIVIASGYLIPTGAEQREQAMALLSFLASPQAAETLASQGVTQDQVPAGGLSTLESVPDHLRRGEAIIAGADALDVAMNLHMPFDKQQALGRLFDAILRQISSEGTLDINTIAESFEERLR